MNRYEVLVGL